MKKYILFLLLFPSALWAQHNRAELLQPNYDTYNLQWWPRQMTVLQHYATGQDINFQETYLFDSVGNLTEYSKRGFGGIKKTTYPLTQLNPRMQYDFDYDGDILRILEFDLKQRLISSEHYIYGTGGKLVETIKYSYSEADSGAVIERQVTTYDKKERSVTTNLYSPDELLLVAEKIKYDRRGNNIKRTITYYDEESTTVTIEKREYTYDKHGNWTKCRFILDGKPIYTIERSIEYYGENK